MSTAVMSRSLLLLALLSPATAVAAKKREVPSVETAVPAWTTPEGERETRLEVLGALIDGGQADAALQLIAKMNEEGVSSPELDVLQARALRAVGLTDDAEALLREVVRRDRRLASAHNELGILALDAKDTDNALDRFRQAVKLEPSNPDYANNLGFALMSAGRAGDAIPVLREALQQDATIARVRNNLGFALLAEGQTAEAYRVFRAGAPEDEARYNLGVGLELRGDAAAAADAYADALKVNPQHARAQEALARLQETP